MHMDSLEGELLGSCEVKNTGGFQSWTTVSTTVKKTKGVHDIYFVFKGSQGDLFNFNWWRFDK
ncbi:carbohydrate-binding protein [Pedobacter sp. NJ-S-72]